MERLKSEEYMGYTITFRKYPNGKVLGETRGILVGVFDTKKETFDYIKKIIKKNEDAWKKRRNSEYVSLEEFQERLGLS